MDALSIIGIIASIGSVADIVTRSVSILSQFRAKYREAPMIITVLIGQLCTIRAALDQLQAYSEDHLKSDPRYEDLAKHMGEALHCFTPLMQHLERQLNTHEQEEMKKVSPKKRLSFVWKDQELSSFFQMLDCQVNALTLLLQAVQCKTWSDQRHYLNLPDSKVILRSAKDCSSSVCALKDGSSSHGKDSVADSAGGVNQTFDFDDLLLHSKVYNTAYRSHVKQIMIANRAYPQPKELTKKKVGRKHFGKHHKDKAQEVEAPPIELELLGMPDSLRAAQMVRYSFLGSNYLIKKNENNKTTTGYPVSFADDIDFNLEFAITYCSQIQAADIYETARSHNTSGTVEPHIPALSGKRFAAALGWIAEDCVYYLGIHKEVMRQRTFPRNGSLPGYLHLELYIFKGPLTGRVLRVSVQLVDWTDYESRQSQRNTSFMVVCNSIIMPISAYTAAVTTTEKEKTHETPSPNVVMPPLPPSTGPIRSGTLESIAETAETLRDKEKDKRHSDQYPSNAVAKMRWSFYELKSKAAALKEQRKSMPESLRGGWNGTTTAVTAAAVG